MESETLIEKNKGGRPPIYSKEEAKQRKYNRIVNYHVKRYNNDPEFKANKKKFAREYYEKNKTKILEKAKKRNYIKKETIIQSES